MRQGIFLPQSASSADSLTVSVQPPCAIACTTSVRTLEIPPNGKHTIVRTQENTADTLTGMGGAALALSLIHI